MASRGQPELLERFLEGRFRFAPLLGGGLLLLQLLLSGLFLCLGGRPALVADAG